MKKRISAMLALVLVLVAVMSVCLVGCGPKMDKSMKKAFKGVDMKDGSAIVNVIKEGIENRNITIRLNMTTYETESLVVSLDGNKIGYLIKEIYDDEMITYQELTVNKDNHVEGYSQWEDFGWEVEELGDETFDELVKENVEGTMINGFLVSEYQYNKDDKNFTTKMSVLKEIITVTMTVKENCIEFSWTNANDFKYTIAVSNIGTTSVSMPDVKA